MPLPTAHEGHRMFRSGGCSIVDGLETYRAAAPPSLAQFAGHEM